MAKESTFINRDMLEPYICSDAYSSIMVMGDELVGEPAININMGTLKPHTRLPGSHHEKAEIYYVVACGKNSQIVTGGADGNPEKRYDCAPGDIVFIPGGCHHWINNENCDEEFVIMTMWPRQEDNGMFNKRFAEWGTSFRFKPGCEKK